MTTVGDTHSRLYISTILMIIAMLLILMIILLVLMVISTLLLSVIGVRIHSLFIALDFAMKGATRDCKVAILDSFTTHSKRRSEEMNCDLTARQQHTQYIFQQPTPSSWYGRYKVAKSHLLWYH